MMQYNSNNRIKDVNGRKKTDTQSDLKEGSRRILRANNIKSKRAEQSPDDVREDSPDRSQDNRDLRRRTAFRAIKGT